MISRTLSEYRILEELGSGGMGVVYKAEDIQLKHTVALKFLPPDLTRDSDARERFLQEARIAFSLDHPNICTVHGIGETDEGQIFIVLAYYEGETVKQKIARGPLAIKEVQSIVTQVAHGLAAAHEHGVVHRDIKPANIMVTTEGTVKILDFGIAKLTDQTKLSHAETTAGTIAYMSPEQVRGEKVDSSTDIWALGAVLYEMLSGQPPFRGEYHDVILYSILNLDPVELATLRSGIPKDLSGLCRKCLVKEREKRPDSGRMVLDALRGTSSRTRLTAFSFFSEISHRRRVVIFASAFLVACALWIILRPPPTPDESPLIAVLPIRNLTGVDSVNDWIEPLQSMVADNFRSLGVYTYDIRSINDYLKTTAGLDISVLGNSGQDELYAEGIRYLVDGTIGLDENGFTLQMAVQDLEGMSYDRTAPVQFDDFPVIEHAVFEIIPTVADFIHIKQISGQKIEDLRPWIRGRRSNILAHKELMHASFYVYRVKKGGEEHLRRAIELDSMFVTPRVWLISSLMYYGKREEALNHYNFLRRIEAGVTGFDQTMIDWCESYIQGDTAAQARHLEIALEYSPGNNILTVNLARMRYMQGDWEETIRLVEPAIRMRWTYSPVYWFYAAAKKRLGLHDEALDALKESLEYTPSVYFLNYGLLAGLCFRKGDSLEASMYQEKFLSGAGLQEFPLSWAHGELGSVYAEDGLLEKAIGQYRLALDLQPSELAHHDSMAMLYFRAGRYGEATAEFETVIRLDPGAYHAHYYLGMICEERNDVRCAIEHYQEFLANDSLTARASQVKQRLTGLVR